MSNTPRTDKAVEVNLNHGEDGLSVSVEFARQLERELAAAHRMRELLLEAKDYILYKAQRHDLYWKDGYSIIDSIDAALAP